MKGEVGTYVVLSFALTSKKTTLIKNMIIETHEYDNRNPFCCEEV